ncbi:hypothetical protein [Robertkochia solimangrovi]|uniref:hypothetical protein n=1 Tax=Robertkochia solimangrovi TaxID=2213046 RepID=UPI00117DB2E0|nr:hypothetical protein [Robertkochia solimangrovi]
MNVEIYTTNVKSQTDILYLLKILLFKLADCELDFDLRPQDSLLVATSNRPISEMLISTMRSEGFECSPLYAFS